MMDLIPLFFYGISVVGVLIIIGTLIEYFTDKRDQKSVEIPKVPQSKGEKGGIKKVEKKQEGSPISEIMEAYSEDGKPESEKIQDLEKDAEEEKVEAPLSWQEEEWE